MGKSLPLKACISDAWAATLKQSGGPPAILYLLFTTVGGFFILREMLEPEEMTGIWEDAIAGVLAFCSAALVLFLVNLIAAPARIYRSGLEAAEAKIAELDTQVQALTPKPPTPEPSDLVAAKQILVDFVFSYLRPADEAVRKEVKTHAEMLGRSVYQDARGKGSNWALGAVLDCVRPSRLIPGLCNPANLRGVSLDDTQRLILDALVEYRISVHTLQEMLSALIEHGPFEAPRSDPNLLSWKKLNDSLIMEFEKLQRVAQFERIRSAEVDSYLADPNYSFEGMIADDKGK